MSDLKKLFVILLGLLLLLPATVTFARDVQENAEEDYRNLEIFTDVLALIRSSYVEEPDTQELLYGAIRGMLATLDPHSSFMSPEMFEEMKVDTHGEFGGLGVEIAIKENALIVVSPIEDTPAYRVGIKAGDRIIGIDEHRTEDMEMMEAVKLMRGPKGAPVTLTITREGEQKPLVFTIVRDIIQLESVKSRMLDENYGYVRILQFQDRTASDLRDHLDRLRETTDQLKGVVLDLRNNPGGLLDQAVEVADTFIDSGLIVYTEGRDAEAQLEFSAAAEGTEPDYPLVVMIDGGSASASEIVAGALQDHGRALIIGEQSFGKGSVQTLIPLGDNSGLRLTTARYFTPSGRSIQARGITPDIIIPQQNGKIVEVPADEPLREADLENHFRALPDNHPVIMGDEAAEPLDDDEDYQLQRALELLKGYEILLRGQQAA
ncbi:MAG: peptidase S41 [Desulfuromonas sp.]|nr:MAG: peptidase S41 [Desulfuromonas sp.]